MLPGIVRPRVCQSVRSAARAAEVPGAFPQVPLMTNRHSVRGCAFLTVLVLVMAGCLSNPPKPSNVKLTLRAAADVNPDGNGRPSPVVVRIYQLKTDTAF